jgi:Undecaprenyl-phosphate glucose phosphotransferase
MPYDASEDDSTRSQHRRGPLRPSRLASARSRLGGQTLTRLVQVTDLLLLIALLASGWAKGETNLVLSLLAACSVLTAATLVSFEAYHLGARERLHRHIYRVIGAVGGSGLFLLAFAHLIAPAERAANVLQVVDWCLAAATMLTASHATWFAYIHRLRRQGLLTPNLMIVGATPSAQRLIDAALSSRDVNILGVFDDRSGARRPTHISGVPVLGRTSAMLSHRLLPYVDRIVVAVPPGATARIAELISALAPVPNAVSLLVENEDAAGEKAAHERLLDMPLARLAGASTGATRAMLKRAVDLALSVAAVVALAPLLVTVAIAIRLDSPGPVLFKQRRHGYLNEEVLVWKFRSMRVEASDYSASRQVTADDDRVTRVGRFIRKTSLDELPQLWNVIRGEMSLVGPRPHAIGMLTGGSEASKLVESYAHRHRMKPGLTGWAAVNGSRGPVDTPEAVRRRVSLDLEYVERQSLWLDLSIMARTLPCVLGDAGTVR